MASSKLTESERKRLDNLQVAVNDKVAAYGRQKYIVEQIKNQLEEEKEEAKELKKELSELEEDYDNFVGQLYQKYGDVTIDLDTGNIASSVQN